MNEQIADRIDSLESMGFIARPFGARWNLASLAISCDSCEALVINGTPTHESRCPNSRHECNGCNALVPVRVRYCADCS